MAKSLSELKKNRAAQLEALQKEVAKDENEGGGAREGYWKPSKNKEGKYLKVIRFLPAPQDGEFGEEVSAYVKTIKHNFKGPKGVYAENSLRTIGQPDPVAKFNNFLWNDLGTQAAKKQYGNQKRNMKYVSNILVINDPEEPENNGKVFLYEYPTTVYDKIKAKLTPKEGVEDPHNVFDFWGGADFILQTEIKKDGEKEFPDYSPSRFKSASDVAGGDEDKIQAIWDGCQSLQQFVNPENKDQFKTYEELEAKLLAIFGVDSMDDLMRDDYVPYVKGNGYEKKKEKDAIAKMEEESGATDLSSMLDDDEEEVKTAPKKAAPAKKTEAKKPAVKKEPEPVIEEEEDAPETSDLDDDLSDLSDLDDLGNF